MSQDEEVLTFYTSEATDQLFRAIDASSTPEEFVAIAESIGAVSENMLGLDWHFGTPAPKLNYDRSSSRLGQDANNAKAVFQYLGPMSPVQASDRRLWTYLSLVTFSEYTKERWPLDVATWASRISDRWVMRNVTRGALVRNSIARLWWAASLTYDPTFRGKLSQKSNDPFAFLHTLFLREDAFLAIVDRDSGMSPDLLSAILDHLAEKSDDIREKYVRELMKEVVLSAGYMEFSALGPTEIAERISAIGARLGD